MNKQTDLSKQSESRLTTRDIELIDNYLWIAAKAIGTEVTDEDVDFIISQIIEYYSHHNPVMIMQGIKGLICGRYGKTYKLNAQVVLMAIGRVVNVQL